eukprot:48597-Eustigmatos_ZCMA.PRE.1
MTFPAGNPQDIRGMSVDPLSCSGCVWHAPWLCCSMASIAGVEMTLAGSSGSFGLGHAQQAHGDRSAACCS